MPYVAFQLYVYLRMCSPPASVAAIPVVGALSWPDWCGNTLPFSYGSIQQRYWNVGFLRYYQWHQLPNFVLALPMALWAASALLSCGRVLVKIYAGHRRGQKEHDVDGGDGNSSSGRRLDGPAPLSLFGHMLYFGIAMASFLLMAHVQIITRCFASSPLLYWFIAHHQLQQQQQQQQQQKESGSAGMLMGWIRVYCKVYVVVGTVMFCKFLPWT
jgi:phosphatidylinositol glycan class V